MTGTRTDPPECECFTEAWNASVDRSACSYPATVEALVTIGHSPHAYPLPHRNTAEIQDCGTCIARAALAAIAEREK